jgi:hypothetical protein
MEVAPGTMVLGMIVDTLRGRSPRYRLEESFAQQDTELLLGKALPPEALHDDTVGRVLDRLSTVGTMKICTACAVGADQVCGFDTQSGHFDATARSVHGDDRLPEDQEVPCTMTHG